MKNKFFIICIFLLFLVITLCLLLLNNKDSDSNIENNSVIKEYKIIENSDFNFHNTTERTAEIKYIVVHYTGAIDDAKEFIEHYNKHDSLLSSADYFIDLDGTVYQYNMDIDNRYSWAVGGKKRNTRGGHLYGIVSNNNSISIEMCVDARKEFEANNNAWILTEDTINSTIILIKKLMKEYDIPFSNVIRHYDVNGKLCPGVVGWNLESGSQNEWIKFKDMLLH